MTLFSNAAAQDDNDGPGDASVSGLHRYVYAARQFGVDADRALAALGLNQKDLQNAQLRQPAKVHEQLLTELANLSGDPLFGLKAGQIVQPDAWSVLGYILINCACLGDAMTRVISYEKLVGELGVSRVESRDGRICMSWHTRLTNALAKRHMVENVLASWLAFGQWAADSKRLPCEVLFEHSLPDGAAESDYQQFFGCPVFFEQPCSGIVIDQDMLTLPLRQPDPDLLSALEMHAQEQLLALGREPRSWALLVQTALRRQLKAGRINKSELAASLKVSARTLQRHLRNEGTHYQEILDELRREQAEHRLADPKQSFAEIAQALGYLEPASFHRKFKTWTGITPGEYRSTILSESDKGSDLIR